MADFQKFLHIEVFTIAGTQVDVMTLIVSVSVGILSFIFARLAERAAVRFMQARTTTEDGSVHASARLVYYLILGVGLAVSVENLGIHLTALFTAGAVLAIAFGFAMQNITQNFVSGLILLLERTIKPGDIIEVEDRVVKVTKSGMRTTIVRTWDDEDFIIPNSVLVSATVKNLTLRDRQYRIRSVVGVSYDSDMKTVRRVLEQTAAGIPWREPSPDPVVLMKEFGSSSVDFDVSLWVDDPWSRSSCQSKLNEAIWFALKQAGITIAYPQLDLHLDRAVLKALEARAGGPSPGKMRD